MSKRFASLFIAAMLLAMVPSYSQARASAAPLYVFKGDGLVIRVTSVSDDETRVSGEIVKEGAVYPFTGRFSSADDDETEVVKGTYRAGEQAVSFTTTQRGDEKTMTFESGGKQYRLRETSADQVPDANDESKPVTGDGAAAQPDPGSQEPAAPVAMPDEFKLCREEFRDVNMNNVVAYTMLVPADWKAEGHIEWSQEKTPYPQKKIRVTGADQSRISFIPAMTFSYSEATEIAKREAAAMGIRSPIPDRQGVPPPLNLGEWIVSMIRQNNKEVTELRLVSDVRNKQAEESMARLAQQQQPGNNNAAPPMEIHLVTISFELNGVPFTEEIRLTYGKLQPMMTRNMNIWSWMLFTDSDVRAPSARFAQLKPMLYASVNSLRPVPKWWTQQQLLLMEITRQNHIIGMEEIRRRGEHYNQISDQNYADWKKSLAPGDAAQNKRINGIYEVDDFRDTDGTPVKLPIHYKNYYSDGNGNFLMNNSTMLEPPGSEWKKIEPVQ